MADSKCCMPGCDATEDLVQIQKEDLCKGYKNQYKCRPCNNQKFRILRQMKGDDEMNADWKAMSVDERSEFTVKAAKENWTGDQLKKELRSTVTWSKINRNTQRFNAKGMFLTKEELKDVSSETEAAWIHLCRAGCS